MVHSDTINMFSECRSEQVNKSAEFSHDHIYSMSISRVFSCARENHGEICFYLSLFDIVSFELSKLLLNYL